MKNLPFLILLFCLSNCSEEAPNSPTTKAQPVIPKIWTEASKDENLRFLYDCNNGNDIYQVELESYAMKDLVLLTVDLSNPDFDLVYYSRFKPHIGDKGFKATIKPPTRALIFSNPVTKDTMFLVYKKPIQIKIQPKDTSINHFLSEGIWGMFPHKERHGELFHGESWTVKGRKDGKEIQITRSNLTDSTYYSNIQHILNLCKIKDYAYPQKN